MSTIDPLIDQAVGEATDLALFLQSIKDARDADRQAEQAQAEADAEAIKQEAERVAALPGRVRFFRNADKSFDGWTSSPTPEQQQFMRDHYARMRVNSPYFDAKLAWYPGALAYKDAYAIYVGQETAQNKPWILKDFDQQPLYVKFPNNPPYAQYAADITNPAYRAAWIDQARTLLAKGYRGLVIDDVNYYRMIARADGKTPLTSPCAAGVMTDAWWRVSMALFMAEIRDALDCEIGHNVIWQVPETSEVAFGLRQADWVEKEGGVNDPGLTGGTGKFSLEALLRWAERRHGAGVSVVWDSQAKGDAQREYGLACYLLVNDGSDLLGSREGGTPGDWWAGYDLELGKPLTSRTKTGGLHRRDFEHGYVYVNEPGALSWEIDGVGTLGPASGAVILNP